MASQSTDQTNDTTDGAELPTQRDWEIILAGLQSMEPGTKPDMVKFAAKARFTKNSASIRWNAMRRKYGFFGQSEGEGAAAGSGTTGSATSTPRKRKVPASSDTKQRKSKKIKDESPDKDDEGEAGARAAAGAGASATEV